MSALKTEDGNGRRVNELIDKMVSVGAAALVSELGADIEAARELMRDVAHDVCVELGGGPVYLSKDIRFELTKRDLQMFEEWRAGATAVDQARKYRLTVARVYQIIKACRDTDRAKRQLQLPGLT